MPLCNNSQSSEGTIFLYNKTMFKEVSAKINFPELTEKLVKYWEENKVFEKSVNGRPKDNFYSFYDGPPFVTGLPHYGTLLPSIAKDVVPRYQTLRGKRVPRVWGWDCHGLPIENKVEKKLGLKNRRDILKYGINKFIEECRKYVEEASPEWRWYINHVGRWVDFDHAYRTMDLPYMETVIWVFKQLYEKGLIYKGNRVSLFCPRCSTPVSNFEIAMDDSYAMMDDPAITIAFKLKDGPHKGDWLLAWTTTPWTLPSNRALVVDSDETYAKFSVSGKEGNYIVAKKRLDYLKSEGEIKLIEEFKGKELLNSSYEGLYDFFPANAKDLHVYSYEGMVNMKEGTGIVHSAPGFGDIDTDMGKHYGLTLMFAVNDEGKFVDELGKWAGLPVKEADEVIMKDLADRGLLFKKERISHRYPFCYRCESRLIYKAQESWFINVQKIKDDLLKTNENINWIPGHYKHGRFKKGIESAPDWCISRTRYWATIMPVWECEKCKELKVAGSIEEIENLGGQKVTDLHRSGVDHITFVCPKCSGVMRRIPEVLDCWMESGSMPYAQKHYPFENKEEFKKSFPADFIVEYTAQVRAWFYVMHVISNALMGKNCFKNVVVTGVMAGTDGRKMSKSYGNYPDPKDVLQKYGGDALRLYLMGSVIMLGRDMNITGGEEIMDQIKTTLLPLWNSYRYFVTFANLHEWKLSENYSLSENIMDKWIISRINNLNKSLTSSFDKYNIPTAVSLIKDFVDDLSRWYIRRSRDRFNRGDKDAFSTLYKVLCDFCVCASPIIPFITEEIFKNLTGKESVHLQDWPEAESYDPGLIKGMKELRKMSEVGNSARKTAGIKVRQPLAKITFENAGLSLSEEMTEILKDELNVKEVIYKVGNGDLSATLDTKITQSLREEGEVRELIRRVQELRKSQSMQLGQKIIVTVESFPQSKELEAYFKKQTLAVKIIKGKGLKIESEQGK